MHSQQPKECWGEKSPPDLRIASAVIITLFCFYRNFYIFEFDSLPIPSITVPFSIPFLILFSSG